jgi:hypothetical protein
MRKHLYFAIAGMAAATLLVCAQMVWSQIPAVPKRAPDAVQEAQTAHPINAQRPEQKLTEHDRAGIFAATKAENASDELKSQPDGGEIRGFDFYRDPLNAKKPMETPEEIEAKDKADKPKVIARQRELLEKRYDLTPKLDPEMTMSRGKPLAVGPTARLAQGRTWE